MLYFDEVRVALDKAIAKLRLEGTSSRLPTIRDYDDIVSRIAGLEQALDILGEVRKNLERIDDDDFDS